MYREPELPFAVGDVCAGRYRTRRIIGWGGMGVVYEAEHCFTRHAVALKVLYAPESDLPERMAAEARALASVQHPHVVRVHDGGVTSRGLVWFAMELLRGRQLRQIVAKRRQLPLGRVLRYAIQIAEGMAAVNELGIIHRDLKPENIFVTDADQVKILDFGLAKFRDCGLKSTDRNMRVLGTFAYLAPERIQGERGDARADIYAFGHVLYEMIAGRHCFAVGPEPRDFPAQYELGMCQIAKEPKPLRLHRPDTPGELDALVRACLEKRPEDRPDSMRRALKCLQRIGDRAPTAPQPPGKGYTQRLPTVGDNVQTRSSSIRELARALRSTEYARLPTFESQALVGAARFGSTEDGAEAERIMVELLCREGTQPLVMDACITHVLVRQGRKDHIRELFHEWAFSPVPTTQKEMRQRLSEIVESAREQQRWCYADDALRLSRVVYGVCSLVAYDDRDHEAASALYELPTRTPEDNQLAHFGLLLLTRLGREDRRRTRDAIKAIASPSEDRRDAGRAQLGSLLTDCIGQAKSQQPAAAQRPPRPSAAPMTPIVVEPRRPAAADARPALPVWGILVLVLVVAAAIISVGAGVRGVP